MGTGRSEASGPVTKSATGSYAHLYHVFSGTMWPTVIIKKKQKHDNRSDILTKQQTLLKENERYEIK